MRLRARHLSGHLLTPTIRFANAAHTGALVALAVRTFRDAFGAGNRAEDLELYLATAYGDAQQARELADPQIQTLVAVEDGALIGFAQLRHGEAPACVTGPAPIELWRFYLLQEWHGRGLAQRLMDRVLDAARNAGADTIWLGVWEHNLRARAFYFKAGYADVGTQVFMLGTDPQSDRILMRALTPDASASGRAPT